MALLAKEKKAVIKISTFLDASTKIDGHIFSENNLKIDGNVNGNVTTLKDVLVSQTGIVNGNITANAAVIDGVVTGNIMTNDTITLSPSGRIEGDVQTVGLIADVGSTFHGNCKVHQKVETPNQQPATFEMKVPQQQKQSPRQAPRQQAPMPQQKRTEEQIASELLAQVANEVGK